MLTPKHKVTVFFYLIILPLNKISKAPIYLSFQKQCFDKYAVRIHNSVLHIDQYRRSLHTSNLHIFHNILMQATTSKLLQ